jgi:hypothetical protein
MQRFQSTVASGRHVQTRLSSFLTTSIVVSGLYHVRTRLTLKKASHQTPESHRCHHLLRVAVTRPGTDHARCSLIYVIRRDTQPHHQVASSLKLALYWPLQNFAICLYSCYEHLGLRATATKYLRWLTVSCSLFQSDWLGTVCHTFFGALICLI